MFLEGDSSLPSEGIVIVNYGCKDTEYLRDLQVLCKKMCNIMSSGVA